MRGLGVELSYRARRILYSLVTEYIATGTPVGSRTLVRKYPLNISAATARNELADLESAGLVTQQHTSSGRVPTEKGFRVFVDALVQMREVTVDERDAIATRLRNLAPGRDDIVRETGKLLSEITGTAALIAPPLVQAQRLAQIRFIPLREDEILAVMVMKDGTVQNRAVPLERGMPSEELERIHNYLAEHVEGQTLAGLRDTLAQHVEDERGEYVRLRAAAREMVDKAASQMPSETVVVIEGQRVLFDRPEFTDPDKIRTFVRAFEEREHLLSLLDRTLRAGGVQVLIGSEADIENLDDISVIATKYQGDGAAGSVGLIGPARVDYGKLVPLVEFTARMISEVLDPRDDGENS